MSGFFLGEEMEEKQELRKLSEEEQNMENLRIRKTEWIQEQIQRQREAEDALFEQMKQEQQALDALRGSMSQNMECTREARKYNQEFQEMMNAQVYAMYGITEDKLQGMREYRNAYYQGCAFSLFFLSVVLVALCGVLHGFQSELCLFMAAFTGIQGALLNQEGRRSKWMNVCSRALYLLMFPLMMVIFICYELKYPEYQLLLPVFTIFGIVVLVLGTTAYFLYNPYRGDRRTVEEARDTIRNIEKTARKEVKKNRKLREREEKRDSQKQQRQRRRDEHRQQRQQKRDEHRQQRQQKRDKRKQHRIQEFTDRQWGLSLFKRKQAAEEFPAKVAGALEEHVQEKIEQISELCALEESEENCQAEEKIEVDRKEQESELKWRDEETEQEELAEIQNESEEV